MRLTYGIGPWSQGDYARLAAPISRRDVGNAYLDNALIDAHASDPRMPG